MAAVIVEHVSSRETVVSPGQGEYILHYRVVGTEDELEVHALVRSKLTLTAAGLLFNSYTIRHVGGGVWEAEAQYGGGRERRGPKLDLEGDKPDKPGGPDAEGWTFDTTGGTGHITNSRTTVARYGPVVEFGAELPGGPFLGEVKPPDVKGAINWTTDGVEGVDIVIPSFEFTETHYKLVSQVTMSYIRDLIRLTGTVNFNYFRTFEPGEVLFLGVTGAQRDLLTVELTFRFKVELNKENFTEADGDILVASKKGHEYMWIRYEEEEVEEKIKSQDGTQETTRKTVVKRPTGVYVESIYSTGNFALLNIGA